MHGEWSRKKVQKAYRRIRPLPPPPDPSRQGFRSACYAPSTSMYFDQFGDVRACCQNTQHLLGNIREQTIREIWDSAATNSLRNALAHGDYSLGCGFCKWQVDQGDEKILFSRSFDDLPVPTVNAEWPVQMEFSMTNSCNLQCVMCNGDWSSSIRTHREHRPALPHAYGEPFFNELTDFLPHLREAHLLGGEPFLGSEPLRVMEMLAELRQPPHVTVTTNGTQWNLRVESICDRLPMSFVVSIDGITKDTYESIRVGASFELTMRNFDRFRQLATANRTRVSIAHCLMLPNVHEFSRLLLFAEDRDVHVGINEVLFPVELSLFQLPYRELRGVLDGMDNDPWAGSLDRLRPVWEGQVAALRNRLYRLERGTTMQVRPWADPRERMEPWSEVATRVLTEWVGDVSPMQFVLGASESDSTVRGTGDDLYFRLDLDACHNIDEVLEHLSALVGPDAPVSIGSAGLLHDIIIGEDGPGWPLQFRVTWDERRELTTVLLAVRNPPLPLVLADDPRNLLCSEHGTNSVLVLSFDSQDRIDSIEGRASIIGLSSADLLGCTGDDLLRGLQQRWGRITTTAGPSGHPNDLLIMGEPSGVNPAPTCRVLIDRPRGGAATIYVSAPSSTEDHDASSTDRSRP